LCVFANTKKSIPTVRQSLFMAGLAKFSSEQKAFPSLSQIQSF